MVLFSSRDDFVSHWLTDDVWVNKLDQGWSIQGLSSL